MILDDFQELKRRHEDAQRAKDKAAGALAELEKRLKTEFKIHSLAEAKQLLTRLRKAEKKALDEYLKEKKKFKERYNGVDRETGEEGEEVEGGKEARRGKGKRRKA